MKETQIKVIMTVLLPQRHRLLEIILSNTETSCGEQIPSSALGHIQSFGNDTQDLADRLSFTTQ